MWRPALFFGALATLASLAAAQRGACTRDISNLTVVDMCEGGSWILGRVFISISSTTMGDNSRCSCILRGKTPTQNTATTFTKWEEGMSNSECILSHVTRLAWLPRPDGSLGGSRNVTCGPTGSIASPSQSTMDIHLTQLRSSPSVIFNYCLFVQPQESTANNLELVCGKGTGTSTSTPAPSTPSIASTSSSSTSSLPQTSPVPATSSLTSPGPGSVAATSSRSEVTDDVTTKASHETSGSSPQTSSLNFPVAPVAGGIVGGVAFIVIVVVIVVTCKRRARQPKPPREERPGVPNVGYENVLVDNVLYESSSAPDNNHSPPPSQRGPTNGRGGYENVHENGGGPSDPFYSAPGDLATVATGNERLQPPFGAGNEYATVGEATRKSGGAQPGKNAASAAATAAAAAAAAAAATAAAARQPTSDEYAVVNKPGRHQKPADSGNAAVTSPSADVTLPSGDVYAVVDKSRTPRHTSPPEASPPPAPAPAPASTPGLNYADLDLVREEGSAVTPRSSAEIPAASDYAEIDHTAQSVRM